MATCSATNSPSYTMSNLLMSMHKMEPFATTFGMNTSISTPTATTNIIDANCPNMMRTIPVQRKLSRGESIHSGHFMVSEIEENEIEESEKSTKQTAHESDLEHDDEPCNLSSYELLKKNNESTQTYVYGAQANGLVQIDGSLTKLFECMSLAYNGKITSPRWKTFKGLKMHIKDKIRLNNIIWRAWHIQYIAGRIPVVCQFSSSVDSKHHKRSEAILLEGKYWKRRVDAIKEEYKKWRMFHYQTGVGADKQIATRPTDFDWDNLPRWSNNLSNIDSLFSCDDSVDFFINTPNSMANYCDYNPRDLARSGMGAQFMQPGLEQLQPNIDFMDTFEPIHDVISRIQNHNYVLPTVQEENASFEVDINNKEQDELLSLFGPNAADQGASSSMADTLPKPMLQPNSYSGNNVFTNNAEMLDLNVKLDNSNVLVGQPAPVQQQQPIQGRQAVHVGNYGMVSKLEIASSSDYCNYSNSLMNASNVMPSYEPTQSIQESASSVVPQITPAQLKVQMPITSAYDSNRLLTFEPLGGSGQLNNSSIQNDTNTIIHRYQQRLSSTNVPIQTPSVNQVNIFQPESNMFYRAHEITNKNAKNKYTSYSTYYQSGTAASTASVTTATVDRNDKTQHFHDNSASCTPEICNTETTASTSLQRSRSRSISMPGGNKCVTIKSLLNKPSLVSTMGVNDDFLVNTNADNATTARPNAFRVPAVQPNDTQIRNNMERSLSLPIYAPIRERKSDMITNPQLIRHRLSSGNESLQSGVMFESSTPKLNEMNASSFDSGGRGSFYSTSYSATTSPQSSHSSSSYSNQDSQLLPQPPNVSLPIAGVRKLSTSALDYMPGKISDSQSGNISGVISTENLSFRANKSNMISNLLQANTSIINSQSNIFNPQLNASSSSSSPVSNMTDNSTNNGSHNPTCFPLAGNNLQTQFSKPTSRFKAAHGKDKNFSDSKRSLRKPKSAFSAVEFVSPTVAENTSPRESVILSDSVPSVFPISDLSPNGSPKISFKSFSGNDHFGSHSAKSEERSLYRERRRVCHINAEQKRRCNIKNGFDTLRNLLPNLNSNANTKISKASMLQKAADYIRILKSEKFEQQKEYETLKQQVESLNQTISVFQNQLPATGAPLSGQRSNQIKEQYAQYVLTRTMQNWKFWIFSIIMESLLESYCNTVATANFDEMCKTLFRWIDQSCCLITLRRDVLNSLRFISTSTNILTNPESISEEALLAVTQSKNASNVEDSHTKFR